MEYLLGIDIGGTHVKGGIVTRDYREDGSEDYSL